MDNNKISESPGSAQVAVRKRKGTKDSDVKSLDNEIEEQLKINSVKQGLNALNPYLTKKIAERQTELFILEISFLGTSEFKYSNIRELYTYIRQEAEKFDKIEIGSSNHSRGAKFAVSSIQQRDVRRLDFQCNLQDEAIVIVRKHVVLIAFDPLRVVIMADRIILIIPDGADSLLNLIQESMKAWVLGNNDKNNEVGLPFESHAYEAIIATVLALQNQEYDIIHDRIQRILNEYKSTSTMPIDTQETMRLYKNKVISQTAKVRAFRNSLSALLENEEDLALMNLTKLKITPSLYDVPLSTALLDTHEEIEVLLESYLSDYTTLETKLSVLQMQIQNAEELLQLRLDTSRNQILVVEMIISVITCSLSFGSFIGSMFGMNLPTKLYYGDDTPFTVTFILTVLLMFSGAILTILYFQYAGIIPSKY
jgi:magnesium transporter